MSRFWSDLVHSLEPYAPGEQPRMAGLVKLNTNESPFGPSPRVLKAIRVEAADTLRLYPDPDATALRQALSAYHGVKPEQVFVGNGSDEVLAHIFAALLKHKAAAALSRHHLQPTASIPSIADCSALHTRRSHWTMG